MIFESQMLFDQFSGYAEKGLYDEVVNRFGEMHMGLFNLDLVAHVCSLKAYGLVRQHSQLVKMGLEGELPLQVHCWTCI